MHPKTGWKADHHENTHYEMKRPFNSQDSRKAQDLRRMAVSRSARIITEAITAPKQCNVASADFFQQISEGPNRNKTKAKKKRVVLSPSCVAAVSLAVVEDRQPPPVELLNHMVVESNPQTRDREHNQSLCDQDIPPAGQHRRTSRETTRSKGREGRGGIRRGSV